MRTRLSTLRIQLFILVLLGVLPALGLMLYSATTQRKEAIAGVQETALRLAGLASSEHGQHLTGTEALLVALAHMPEIRHADTDRCRALLGGLLEGYQVYANFGVVAPDGRVVCSAMPVPPSTNVADRSYFRRAVEARTFAIGDYQIGRITGRATVNAAYPIVNDQHTLEAVVFAAIDLSALNEVLRHANLPPDSSLTVTDGLGTILVRYPDPDRWVGKSLPDSPDIAVVLASRAGVAEAIAIDGVPTLLGFSPLLKRRGAGDVYVSIGIPRRSAVAGANRELALQLLALVVVAAVGFAVASLVSKTFVVRPVESLLGGSRRVAAGDLSVRLPEQGGGELQELTHAFNEMTAALERDRAEREDTQRQLHTQREMVETINEALTGEVAERKRAEEALAQHAERLRMVHEIDRALIAEKEPAAIAEAAVRPLRELLGVARAIVNVFDLATGEVEWLAAAGRRRVHLGPGVRYSLALAGDIEALRRGETQVVDVHALPPSPETQALLASGVNVYMVVPMIAGGELIGSVSFGGEAGPFPVEQVSIAQEAATQLAIAIAQARLHERVKRQAEELEQRVGERTRELSTANQRLEEEIGERRRAEAEADRANRAKSEFLSRMSHELRTPLNGILGFGQLLEAKVVATREKESVEQILRAGRHLLMVINEVLEISRIEAGRMQLSLEPVPVSETVRQAVALVQPAAGSFRIAVRADVIDERLHALADRQRLQQVLLNLLANAVKYNRPGGDVVVSCEAPSGNRVRIHVADTGQGIAEEKLERLFTPFDRLGVEASGVEGTGLGLALSKHLVTAMGGTLLVRSQVEVGSTFSVELPVAAAPAAVNHATSGVGPGPASDGGELKVTILYIEDNLSNLRLVECILDQRPGVTLLSAMQGRRGLELARDHRPGLILLDRHLPDVPGDEVFRILREDPRTQDIPVVILSADASPGQVQRLLDAGARAYLTKPLDVRRFLEVVDESVPRAGA